MSCEHRRAYTDEFAGRRNPRPFDTVDQMASLLRGGVGKRLTYEQSVT
ncbi:MAG: hypothetical protein OXI96_06940 [Acidimicrobiaceae bacterium]|nr:hypothetical protein [Acidimicrobiaceae bacterium]